MAHALLEQPVLNVDYPGWGTHTTTAVVVRPDGALASCSSPGTLPAPPPPKPGHLGQLAATALSGNDLLSSCLYSAGICTALAGSIATISLLLVGVMLFLFRFVYTEVVSALPVNGGSYTALINTTSKRAAAIAGCLSLLSYVATAVVSAASASLYAQSMLPAVDVRGMTVVILALFAALAGLGVTESAAAALALFLFHLVVMSLLVVWALIYAAGADGFATLLANIAAPLPTIVNSEGVVVSAGTVAGALYFGYSSALLGITGFETTANFVEELSSARIFAFTMRNLWILVCVYNPLLSLAALSVLPLPTVYAHSGDLLSALAAQLGGGPLQAAVCVDAVLVLSGAVLTAYVGVGGLARRMALDGCLPPFLLATNAARGTSHWIILSFFALCAALFLTIYDESTGKGGRLDGQAGNTHVCVS